MIPIETFIEAARAFIGTPFKMHGRKLGVGIDCNGLLILASCRAGVEVEDFQGYSHPAQPQQLIDELLKLTDPVPKNELGCGDVLVFCVRANKPAHFAIATPVGMCHADWGVERVVEHRIPMSWANRFYGGYRPRGFTLPTLPIVWPNPKDEHAASR